MNQFIVSPSAHHIWNRLQLEQFLVDHQHQDIQILTQDEGCDCEAIGLYSLLDLFKFKSVTIRTCNPLENHNRYEITLSPSTFKFFNIDQQSVATYQKMHQWNFGKIFGVLYNRPIWHRLGIVSHMYMHHRSKTLINFRSDPSKIDERKLFEIDQLFTNHPESSRNFLNCYHEFPITLKDVDDYTKFGTTKMHTDQLCEFYPDFLIDIVAETFTNGNTFFTTEKTVRPMLLKKPMIVMGGKNHLLYLRQMGFRTFGDFWDESYDGFEGPDRYIKILDLIDKLSKESAENLEMMYLNMQYTLEHNYNLLIAQSYSTQINRID